MKKFPLMRRTAGFTLVELLVSTSIVLLLMLMLVSMTDSTSRTWRYATQKIEQFQGARVGFESMTRRLSQATLNTYWAVDSRLVAKNQVPDRYVRCSELRFVLGPMEKVLAGSPLQGGSYRTHGVFFQAPMGFVDDKVNYGGLNNLVNAWGYFLEVGQDGNPVPPFLEGTVKKRWRSRLKEFMQPSEKMAVYKYQDNGKWYTEPLSEKAPPVRTLAENIVALVLVPKLAPDDAAARAGKVLTKDFYYNTLLEAEDEEIDSRHQLPPLVQVTMVAIDEASARSLEERFAQRPNLGVDVDGLFKEVAKLQRSTDGVPGDIDELERRLAALKVSYRVFSSNVIIRAAKWGSEAQDATP